MVYIVTHLNDHYLSHEVAFKSQTAIIPNISEPSPAPSRIEPIQLNLVALPTFQRLHVIISLYLRARLVLKGQRGDGACVPCLMRLRARLPCCGFVRRAAREDFDLAEEGCKGCERRGGQPEADFQG